MSIKSVAAAAVAFATLSSAASSSKCIDKDVVVIGGGAAGAYASVLLQEDHGQDIVLIEKEAILGGTVDTWIDPETNIPYELGVETFLDYKKATNFFSRLNVSITVLSDEAVQDGYADFSTGHWVNYTAPSASERTAAFEKYLEIIEPWEDYMLPGLWDFPTAKNIPEDLLLPFGDFVAKHGIEAAVPTMWEITSVGLGDFKTELTFFVIQSFPAPLARLYIGKGKTYRVTSHRNQDVYDKVAELLGDNVLYQSKVISAERTSEGVTIVSKNVNGEETTITAKKLLIAVPPTLPNLSPFNLDTKELGIISKLKYTTAFSGGVTASNLPLNTTLKNTDSSGDWMNYPNLPFLQWYKNMNSSSTHHKVMIFGNETLDSNGAQAVVEQAYIELVEAGSLPSADNEKLDWLEFSEHGYVNVRYSAEDFKAGFVQELYSLQGHLSTWYAGAAWSAQLHSPIWAFSDDVVPRVVASITGNNSSSKL